MRVVVIGGSGHIGSYLIPRLVAAEHEVFCVTRGERRPYVASRAWERVSMVVADRDLEDSAGTFGKRIAELEPDVVIDLVCFDAGSASQLVEALRQRVRMLIHCGTIWVHGHSAEVPTSELQSRHPFGDYGIKKAAIEANLLSEASSRGFPVSIIHPGHIVGRGWWPLNPAGNFNPEVFQRLARGQEISIPHLGLETVHHVHADDLAWAFMAAMSSGNRAIGEAFHIVSAKALTLRGYAEAVSRWFGKAPSMSFHSWEDFRTGCSAEDAAATWDHIAHSPSCSIEKAAKLLGYHPRYTSLEAVFDSLEYMQGKGLL
ncbi:MAG: NAD-dependent epimerase/dehydratase family protein [Rectinemataceae bacterium]